MIEVRLAFKLDTAFATASCVATRSQAFININSSQLVDLFFVLDLYFKTVIASLASSGLLRPRLTSSMLNQDGQGYG